MKYLAPSPLIALALIGTQLLGPAALWAMEQRGIRVEASKQLIVTGLAGGEVTAGAKGERRALRFRDTIQPGEQLTVPAQATAEVLIGIRALLAAHGPARVVISEDVPGQTTVQLDQGELTLAVAGTVLTPGQAVTIQTPVARTVVRSGIVKTKIETNGNRVSSLSEEPHGNLHRVSFNAQVAAVTESNLVETIQTFEGSSDVRATVGSGGGATLKAGDSVQVMNGKIITGIQIQANTRIEPTLLAATGGHANTPAGGTENLIASQMALAGGLGQALVGASEGESGVGAGGGNATSNALVSTIFGANLGSGAGSPLAFLFGSGSGSVSGSGGSGGSGALGSAGGTSGAPSGSGNNPTFPVTPPSTGNSVNDSGSGIADGRNDQNNTRLQNNTATTLPSVVGGPGLLLYTERNPAPADDAGTIPGPVKSIFSATTELLRIDGGNLANAPHGGNAPTSRLIVQGLNASDPTVGGIPSNTQLALQPAGTVTPIQGQLFYCVTNCSPSFPQQNSLVLIAKNPEELREVVPSSGPRIDNDSTNNILDGSVISSVQEASVLGDFSSLRTTTLNGSKGVSISLS
jgi:hypothetical protein